ncbi:ammonium transporter [Pholiota conissans]|uniref:Ammonium transporter n=1 Tax=Pholiota conissans TaxID=109636 RepID=A0A9P6CUL9_9AGAR|nr:ammonium transporter [Pholiota conissans]
MDARDVLNASSGPIVSSRALRNSSQYDRADLAFIAVAGAMVFFMVPGLAFLYSGLSRRKSALSLIWAVAASNAIVIFQWYFWGYSLAFSSSATNGFIGNLKNFGLMGVEDDPAPGTPLIPEILYSFFQMEFTCVTAGILMGGLAERGRVLPAMVFIFCWVTIVYCPLACWIWSTHGWAFKWGALDFAGRSFRPGTALSMNLIMRLSRSGGGPVEIGSGVAGLAYSWVLGRRNERELLNFRPHNVSLVGLGTFILWFGWLGFNGGSAFGANLRAFFAIWNTMVAAAFGGMVWCLLDFRIERRWSMVGFCSGTIAGLVAATPSSGYVKPWGSVVIGILAGAICNFATKVKLILGIDDALDLFAEHAVGGIVGLLMNAFFASGNIIGMDDVNVGISGGWVDHNWKQLYIQIAYVAATCGYTFVMTAIVAKLIDLIPGLQLRSTPEGEMVGMDEVEIGEFATDYIELRRDVADCSTFGFSRGAQFKNGDAMEERHAQNTAPNGNGAAHHETDSSDDSSRLDTITEKPENGSVTPAQ